MFDRGYNVSAVRYEMTAQGKTNDHQSFLNSLLMMREQEIKLLSKKLHHQAALDSDGGSGKSHVKIFQSRECQSTPLNLKVI